MIVILGNLSHLLPVLPWWGWVLAAASAVIIGIAKSGFGGGLGILAVPMMIFAMSQTDGQARFAIGTLLPLLLVGDLFSVYHHWRTWDWRNVKLLIPGFTVGVVLGSVVIACFGQLEQGEQYLKIAIGVVCVAWVAVELWRLRFAPQWKLRADWVSGSAAGGMAGFVSTLAHTAGPVITMFLMGQNLAKQTFLGTIVLYFLLGNSIKVPFYVGLGLIDYETLKMGLCLCVFVPIGTTAGVWMTRRMSEKLFRNVIIVIVLLSGLHLIGLGDLILQWLGL